MPVRIRLSRAGAKKRPFYKVVIADSRRARDGRFIERIGSYNPMLQKDNPERVKINLDRAKYWLDKGAKPSDRLGIFLSNMGLIDKPIITEKTKTHLPKDKKKKETKAKPAAEQPKVETQPAAEQQSSKEVKKQIDKSTNQENKSEKKKIKQKEK